MWQLIKCHRCRAFAHCPGVKTSFMRLIFTLLLLVPVVSVAAQTTDKTARLDSLRAEGYEALYNLDYEGARKRFREMMQIAPEHPSGPQCFAASLWWNS
jgi:Tfp pilus assembly protein PilF